MFEVKDIGDGVIFNIKVQPRAAKNEVAGLIGDALKLRITAPPVDGAANDAVIKFFADFFRVPKKGVTIVSGLTSRQKTIQVVGITSEEVKSKLRL
ncbi:MAG: DUF167 domain-containing protein [Desulfitobacteriaceae bacterium]|nr:DUF167 domain-containing protein [Desulfitobacteriaceae bacterium]